MRKRRLPAGLQRVLGPGHAALRQRYDVPGLRILYFGASLKGSAGAEIRMQCFDRRNRVVMNLTAKPDAKNSAGIYTKTQAFTSYVVLSIEKDASGGTIEADNVTLNDDDRDRVEHAPQGDLTEWMQPIWQGTRVVDESVLLLSLDGTIPRGRLLFAPTRVIRVSDYERGLDFVEGKDFVVIGNSIYAVPGSKIPTMNSYAFARGDFPWTDLSGHHVFITYDHSGALPWQGPVAESAAALLPRTMAILRAKRPLTVVAHGDSITVGMNGSGFRNVPPYQPPWATLFVDEIGRVFGDSKIRLYNTALGGATSDWGKDMAPEAVAALKPDLVILAFGMNDFWSNPPAVFRKNIEAIMESVRKQQPKAEFILISSIKFNPDYTKRSHVMGHLRDYADELRSLVGPGVAMLDMTSISDALYKAKSAADLQTDPMHPDDFLARWYAQGLVQLLTPARKAMILLLALAALSPHTYYLAPGGDDTNDGLSKEHSWRSLARVDAEPLQPGDSVVLTGGAVYQGSIDIRPGEAWSPVRPLVIRSDGNPSTILSTKNSAITIRTGGVNIQNLILKGGASKAREGHFGVSLLAPGKKEQPHVWIDKVDVSGFGAQGISIQGAKGDPNGFSEVRTFGCRVHDNFGTGIESSDDTAFATGVFAHKRMHISDCNVYGNRSGHGIILSGVDGALVEYSSSIANSGDKGGLGMWAWCARHVVFRYCIAGKTRSGGGDGGGFDLDGGCTDCLIEHCLSFHNDGPGYMHCDFPTAPTTRRNMMRSSVSIDDGRKRQQSEPYGFGFVTWGSGLDECTIEHNIVFAKLPSLHKKPVEGGLFVAYITGSAKKPDVPHVTSCLFKDNIVDIETPARAFVRIDLPNPSSRNVRVVGNSYRSADHARFIIGHATMTFEPHWLRFAPKDGPLKRSVSLESRLEGYDTVLPRQLPGYFARLGL